MFIKSRRSIFCLVVGFFLLTAALSPAQTVTGSGTTGYIPVLTQPSTIGNSVITQSGNNVGIGTTAPTFPLHVSGSGDIQIGISSTDANGRLWTLQSSGNNSGNLGKFQIIDRTVAISRLWIDTGGTVGLGVGPGGFVASAANLDPKGSYSLTFMANSGNLLQGWNRTAGGGEIDLISNRGLGSIGGFSFYDYTNGGLLNQLVTFQGNGNVQLNSSSGSITFPDGSIQTTAWTGVLCGGDYAESVDVSGDRKDYEPGDVLIIDPDNPDGFKKSVHPYSTEVAGIYSTKPGVVGRKSRDAEKLRTEIPMAMVGIVPTKVSAENGPIKRGDLLVTSAIVGYAMKGTDRSLMLGAIVGKALRSLNSGTGVIDVLITLQ
jgi:hypothetical protein